MIFVTLVVKRFVPRPKEGGAEAPLRMSWSMMLFVVGVPPATFVQTNIEQVSNTKSLLATLTAPPTPWPRVLVPMELVG